MAGVQVRAASEWLRTAGLVWRRHGRLHLTVVAKATFHLVDGAAMTVASPVAVAWPDPASGHPHDLAPFLKGVGLWAYGHAELAAGVQSGVVRLGIYRDGELLLHRSGPVQRGPAGWVPMACLAPVWRALVLAYDRGIVEVPAELPPDALHFAPPEQRLAWLRGDEWLVLGGEGIVSPQLRSQLPAARVDAQVTAPGQAGELLPLAPDLMQIDADGRRCALVYRGQTALTDERALEGLDVVCHLELSSPAAAGEPALPFRTDVSNRPPPPEEVHEPDYTGTTDLSSMFGGLAAATPFGAASPSNEHEDTAGTGTTDLTSLLSSMGAAVPFPAGPVSAPGVAESRRSADLASVPAATPFEAAARAPRYVAEEAPSLAPDPDAFAALAERLARARADTPMYATPEPDRDDAHVVATAWLSEEALAEAASRAVLPFADAGPQARPPPSRGPDLDDAGFTGTTDLSGLLLAGLADTAVPFASADEQGASLASPMSPGAHFLAAMATLVARGQLAL